MGFTLACNMFDNTNVWVFGRVGFAKDGFEECETFFELLVDEERSVKYLEE